VAKSETVMEILGEYLRELSVLVLVFFPLELSKGTDFSKPLMIKVAEFSFATLSVGIVFSRWTSLTIFVKRLYSAIRREFWNKEGQDG
jgi:hypothetical protein